MLDTEITKLHGLPGIGINGYSGADGINGRGVYFGYINDFFDTLDFDTDARIYDAQYDPNTAGYQNKNPLIKDGRHDKADTDYYTSFIAEHPDTGSPELNMNPGGAIQRKIIDVHTIAGLDYAKIYQYKTEVFQEMPISIPKHHIVIDMKDVNLVGEKDLINKLRFTISDETTFLPEWNFDTNSIKLINVSHLDNVNSLVSALQTSVTEKEEYYGEPGTDSEKSKDEIMTHKSPGDKGYIYYVEGYDKSDEENVLLNMANNILRTYITDSEDLAEAGPRGTVDIIEKQVDLYIDNGDQYIRVPVTLKKDFKEGDVLYIWKNYNDGESRITHTIDYMLIVTKELEQASYTTILDHITKVKPFTLLDIDYIEDQTDAENLGRLVTSTMFEIIDYDTGESIQKNPSSAWHQHKRNFVDNNGTDALLSIGSFKNDATNASNSTNPSFNLKHRILKLKAVLNDDSSTSLNILNNYRLNKSYLMPTDGFYIQTENEPKKLIFDGDLYLNNNIDGIIKDGNYYTPELDYYAKPRDINFLFDNHLAFDFSDNYITNSKPYVLSFTKTSIISTSVYSDYVFDIITWYVVDYDAENKPNVYRSPLIHHLYEGKDNFIACDLTDEILNQTDLCKTYIYSAENALQLNLILKVYKPGMTAYYSKPYTVAFNQYDPENKKFTTVTTKGVYDNPVEESNDGLVEFHISQNLDYFKDSSASVQVSLTDADWRFYSEVVGNSRYIIHPSNNATLEASQTEGYEFLIKDIVAPVEEGDDISDITPSDDPMNITFTITALKDLVPDYWEGQEDVNYSMFDLLQYGSDCAMPVEVEDVSLWNIIKENRLAQLESRTCYIGIPVVNTITREIKTYYYNIYQTSLSDKRTRPEVTFTPILKHKLEKTNNIEKGLLSNQFQYFIDFSIDNITNETWGSYLSDSSEGPNDVSVSLTFQINNYSDNIQAVKQTKFTQFISGFTTIKFLGNTEKSHINSFDFSFDGYMNIDPEKITIKELHEWKPAKDSIKITTDSSLSYQPIETADLLITNQTNNNKYNNVTKIFHSMEKNGYGWYDVSADMYSVVNESGPVFSDIALIKQKKQYTGIIVDNTVTFSGLTLQDCLENKFTLRLFIEEDNPVLTYLNYDIALVSSTVQFMKKDEEGNSIPMTVDNNDSSAYIYTFPTESYKVDINSNSQGVHYDMYDITTGLQVFVLNPISVIGAANIESGLKDVQGSVKLFGSNEIIQVKTKLFDPYVTQNIGVYDYFHIEEPERMYNDLAQSEIISNIFLPKKYGLQDNVKAITISMMDPVNVEETSDSLFFKLASEQSINKKLFDPFVSNKGTSNQDTGYLSVIYNNDLFNCKTKNGFTSFWYNGLEYDAEIYNQYGLDTALFSDENIEINERTLTELDSIETWNYEYENCNYYNENLVMGGNMTKSGNGYYFLKNNDTLKELYADDEIIDVDILKTTQNSPVVYNSTKNLALDDTPYFRALLWRAWWQYPKFTSHNIIPYNLETSNITAFEHTINTVPGFITAKDQTLYTFKQNIKNSNNYYFNEDFLDEYFNKKLENTHPNEGIMLNNITDWEQFIPYNLCYKMYPRVVINNNNETVPTYNILMMRKPTIGNEYDEFYCGFNVERESENPPSQYSLED